jgi:phosphoglycolate phosphatase
MENLVPTAPTAEAVALYRTHHPAVMISGTSLFPGVADTLAELHRRGYRLAVCSNKLSGFTKQIATALRVAPHFRAVLGPDDVGVPKPDPAMLLEALRRLEVSRGGEAVYVGDMAIDVYAGRAAGLPVWLVMGGATGLEPPTEASPDKILAAFADLLDLLPGTGG